MWQIQRGSDILVHGSGFPPLGFCCGDKNNKGKTTFFVLKTHQIIARAHFIARAFKSGNRPLKRKPGLLSPGFVLGADRI